MTINEHADPAVARDLETALERIVGDDWGWQHIEDGEENAPSHVRARGCGPQVLDPLETGKLALGTWQGIFFCEFDGPRDAEGLRDAAPLIEIERLTQAASARSSLSTTSVKVREGAITGFLGPNSAGKTTTLRVVLGLVRPTSGSARVLGQGYRDSTAPFARVSARCSRRPTSIPVDPGQKSPAR